MSETTKLTDDELDARRRCAVEGDRGIPGCVNGRRSLKCRAAELLLGYVQGNRDRENGC